MTNEIDLIEVNAHNFRVLIRSFNSMPFKTMMPIIDLSIKNPESPQLFQLLAQVFSENLPIDKIDEFENLNIQEASEVIAEWMNKE
jgi:hypothetical protein